MQDVQENGNNFDSNMLLAQLSLLGSEQGCRRSAAALGVMLTFNLQAHRLGVASVLWQAIQTAGPGWTLPFQSKLR